MRSRNRRGNRQASMRARLGVATAVLVGGGAVGVAAVAASNHGAPTTAADSAGYVLNFHHTVSEQQALSSALSTWGWSQQKSLTTLAQMAPLRTFSEAWSHKTEFAAQRGVVVLATKKFLVVKSANGKLEVWWLTGGTKVKNVTGNATGLVALTGNNTAAHTAATTGSTAPAAVAMAGSTAAVSQLAAPVTKPTTITVDTGTEVITITITQSTATVTQPATTTATTTATTPTFTATGTGTATPTVTATGTATPTATATGTATATPAATATTSATPTPAATASTQPTFTATKGVARGDLVFVAGVRIHGSLVAELVLFAAPTTATPAPTGTATVTTTPAKTATPQPAVTATASSFSGANS
jgi:hypothetical protein